jgi:tetratricopeptide (TPR) repeat protein
VFKAYLAHSSEDKRYVGRVAELLGRARVVYDTMCFEPGVDFRDSILQGLDKSKLFVFFASKRSLKSTYVKFEITEASWQLLRDEMGSAITIVIDKDVELNELPGWMRRCLISRIESPTQAARVIRRRLIQESGLDKQRPFVGREGDLEEFARELIAPPEEKPRRIIVVSGLDGVGRRTFVCRALQDYLSLEMGPILLLEETASLDKLHWQLLDETMELESRSEVARVLAAFAELNQPEQGREIARLMAVIGKNNVAVVLVDQNALLDDYFRYLNAFNYVVEALTEFEDTYLVLIHNRRPDLSSLPARSPGVAFHRLAPLKLEGAEMLIQQTLQMANLKPRSDQIKTLALYMGGYPPTIELATAYAKSYGLETLMADKSILTDFQARIFAPILSRLQLDQQEWEILRLLAGEPALPLEVIIALLSIQPEECARALRRLIDFNLVLPLEHYFAISPPIREAASKVGGPLTKSDYKRIASRLREVFWKDPDKVPTLGIIDATIHALARSGAGELAEFHDLILPSQLYRVAKEEYNSKNWDAAIDFAQRTLGLDPSRDGARIILCKAWVRKERWPEAERVLRQLEKRGVRAQFYCKGFLEWKRGNLSAAVSAFRSALDAGDRSISVFRDLAHCLFRLGEVDQAKHVLSEAPEWIFGNSYVVDLAAQIAITEKDWGAAKRYVSELEHISSSEDFHYRRATLRAACNQLSEALQDAEVSCGSVPRRFEAMAQRADILIGLGRFPEATSAVEELVPVGVAKRDVKTGLKCKLLLKQGKWREAEVVWQALHRKELPVQEGLRKDILLQKAEDKMTGPADRNQALDELKRIGAVIQLPLVISEEEEE